MKECRAPHPKPMKDHRLVSWGTLSFYSGFLQFTFIFSLNLKKKNLTIIHGMWRRMYVPQSLENPCTDLDQTRTTYSPWPPDDYRGVGVMVIQGQRSLGGRIFKFAGEFNRGHQRLFQGHHHISAYVCRMPWIQRMSQFNTLFIQKLK